MDIKCHRCGEPWEIDTFHDVASERGTSFDSEVRRFRTKGCVATGWVGQCENSYPNGDAILALGDLLGDDVDGLAALLEDFGL